MAKTEQTTSDNGGFRQIVDAAGKKIMGAQSAAIVSLTDTTTGTATDAVDDATASVKDDIASLAAKIEEILVALRAHGIIAT